MRQGDEFRAGQERVSPPEEQSFPNNNVASRSKQRGTSASKEQESCNKIGNPDARSTRRMSDALHWGAVSEDEASPTIEDREEEPDHCDRKVASGGKMPLHEEGCPDMNADYRRSDAKTTNPYQSQNDRREPNRGDEQRSDGEVSHGREQSCEEREPISSQYDLHNENEYEFQLQLMDEEEERMRQDWEETNRMDQENRELAILDELQQIHEEEYPEQHTTELAEAEYTENFVEIDEEDDNLDLLQEGTPLSNDSEIEALVAICDLRDREDRPRSCAGENQEAPSAASLAKTACVVCLEAPRTHAYVPCGHFCVCFSCAKQQTKQKRSLAAASTCPVCQQPSTAVMRIFIP